MEKKKIFTVRTITITILVLATIAMITAVATGSIQPSHCNHTWC